MMCSSKKRRIHGPISKRLGMSSPRICVVLKAEAGPFQQLRRHGQVVLRTAQIFMPKVGSQLRQQTLHIGTVAIPCDHPVNGCGVTKIVQPRWIAGSFIALNACCTPDALKESDDMLIRYGAGRYWMQRRRTLLAAASEERCGVLKMRAVRQ